MGAETEDCGENSWNVKEEIHDKDSDAVGIGRESRNHK